MPEFLSFVRRWFDETFAEATRPQREGWEAIASGRDTLIVAPTGSGKTLAAFLWALDHLHRLGLERPAHADLEELDADFAGTHAVDTEILECLEVARVRERAAASEMSMMLAMAESTGSRP